MAKSKKSPERPAASRKKSLHSAADAVDEQLARYRSMRDFHVTAEPSGGSSKKEERSARDFPSAFRSMRPRICTTTSGWDGMGC